MRLNLFKNIEGKPSPIAAISSNNSTIVLFRRDETLELVDSCTLRSYLSMEFNYKVLSSVFLNFSTVVCGSDCGKLVFFDIRTLGVTSIDVGHRPIRIATKTGLFSSGWNAFYYSTESGVYMRNETESILLYRGSSMVTSLLVSNTGSLIMGNADGRIRVLDGGKIVCELNLSTLKINMICSVTGNRYAAVCDDGSFSHFDIEMGLVLQTVKARDSPLNVCAYTDNRLHLSGADSRMIAFSRSGDKFIKSYQVDTHYAEVKDIEVDNGRILTVGEDTIMSVVWPTADRYLDNKVFHRSVELGVSKVSEDFYINNRSSIDLYSFNTGEKKTMGEDVEDENKFSKNVGGRSGCDMGVEDNDSDITFRLSESSAESMGYRRQDYRHTAKICTEGRIYSSAASPDFTHIAYSNSSETRIINLDTNGKIEVEKDIGLVPANRLVLTDNLIILQSYKYEVLLVDIVTKQMINRISFDDHREVVYSVGDILVFGHSKTVYSLSNIGGPSKLDINGHIVGVCGYCENSFFVLAVADGTGAKKRYTAYRVPLSNYVPVCVKSFDSYALILSVFHFKGKVGFLVPNAIHIFDEDMKEEKYPLGAIMYGCDGMRDGMVAIQDSWGNIRLNLPQAIFKEKFSNK